MSDTEENTPMATTVDLTQQVRYAAVPGQQVKPPKPIELVKYISELSGHSANANMEPKVFSRLVLVERFSTPPSYDLILAYGGSGEPYAYLGHWNDGVV